MKLYFLLNRNWKWKFYQWWIHQRTHNYKSLTFSGCLGLFLTGVFGFMLLGLSSARATSSGLTGWSTRVVKTWIQDGFNVQLCSSIKHKLKTPTWWAPRRVDGGAYLQGASTSGFQSCSSNIFWWNECCSIIVSEKLCIFCLHRATRKCFKICFSHQKLWMWGVNSAKNVQSSRIAYTSV